MDDPTVLGDANARLVRLLAPERDDILAEIEAHNRDRGFPMVGPEVGGLLSVVAGLVDATRIFEFGSGLGYSGYWFARALPETGLVVLTEEDADEMETAREFFERGGLADRAVFEVGDAHETFGAYDGAFDVVLIDHQKERYREAFEAAKGKLAPGGVIVADNAISAGGGFDRGGLLEYFEGGDPELDSMTGGVAEYLESVRADPDFETVLLPLGEGIALTVRD